MHWDLPTDGPKTINGLGFRRTPGEHSLGTRHHGALIAGYPVEIVQTQDNAVKIARIRPDERRDPAAPA